MTWIDLGPDEVAVVKLIGSRRYHSSRNAGSEDVHFPHDESAEIQDWHAAGAEWAACKHVGGYWEAIDGIGSANAKADIRIGNRRVQVRHSTYQSAFLPIYPEDRDMPFIFVVGELPRFRMVGWIQAADAKSREFWSERNPRTGQRLRCPCFVIEQGVLDGFDTAAAVSALNMPGQLTLEI